MLTKFIEPVENAQNSTNIKPILDNSSTSLDLLKVSDTTLESSSCDDGKY